MTDTKSRVKKVIRWLGIGIGGLFLLYVAAVLLFLIGTVAFSYFNGTFPEVWAALMGV